MTRLFVAAALMVTAGVAQASIDPQSRVMSVATLITTTGPTLPTPVVGTALGLNTQIQASQ